MYPEIVLGPPGTGKTTRLLGMVEDSLARGVPPEEIGYFSFTKKAAQEAMDRAKLKFGLPKESLRYFRTLHSMCFNALGLSNSDVFEGKKVVEFGHWLGTPLSEMRFSDDGLLTGFSPGDRAMFMENLSRVRCVSLRDQYDLYNDGLAWNFVEWFARGMQEYKRAHSLLDYTDMLDHFIRSEWTPNLQELYVDEFQDLSRLQLQVVEKLASTARRVVIAGDDDQAIYRWAGAAVEEFVDMPGTVSVLGQSWRCPPEVQALSQEVIDRVAHRRPKKWAPREGVGQIERLMSFDEVDLWGEDVLVLGRNQFVLRDIMEPIRRDGIIYEWHGHSSISQPILQAVRHWEALRRGETITADDAKRVYEYMSSGRGVKRGYKTLPGLLPDHAVNLNYLKQSGGLMTDAIWHEALDRIPTEESGYLKFARERGETTTGKARVRLSTIHGAKGGEARHVVLIPDMADRTWNEFVQNPEDEARVWYVAVTRAIEKLTIVAPRSRMRYDV